MSGITGTSAFSQMIKEKEFHDELPSIINSLVANPICERIPSGASWIQKLFRHNLIGGKNTRGLTTVLAYEVLEKPGNVTEESLRLARTLGWCVEMAFLVMMDDIMDDSSTRRGMPSWYRMPDVGIGCAINDSVIITSSLFHILKTNFSNKLNYVDMINAFNETMLYTAFGQYLDYKSSDNKKRDYNLFTIDHYDTIAEYKTAHYTYTLPISLGLFLSNYRVEENTNQQIREICLETGKLFQIQDDFIDCYGDESLTGKKGSDIQEGKCTWLAVTALQRCTEAQRVVFKACYGSKEPAHVERIKRLYDQLQMPEAYMKYEDATYESILKRVHELPTGELRSLFRQVLDIMYQRKK